VAAHGGWPTLLSTLIAGSDLSQAEAEAAMTDILAGIATQSQIAGLLVGLKAKGEESVAELTGFATAMLAAAEPLTVDERAIDIVGTGGSDHRRRHALNVSTMACLVAAAAGAVICKHGNRKASSTSGSSDFLEALGIPIDLGPAQLQECVERVGIGFAFARRYHPAVRFAGPVRVELGVPTAFNLLGPMANPARVTRQLIGVASPERAGVMAEVLVALGLKSAWVVSGAGGLDELSTIGDSVVYRVQGGVVQRGDVALEPLGLEPASLDQLAGGSAEDNLSIFRRILAGQPGPHRDIVVLNAGAALVVAGLADDIAEGIGKAAAAIDDGRTDAKLNELVTVANQLV
jgi:anthranilate phosphoribosyltransferase